MFEKIIVFFTILYDICLLIQSFNRALNILNILIKNIGNN